MSFIVNDKIPINCQACNIAKPIGSGICFIKGRKITKDEWNKTNKRPDWCPLVEIPIFHGRLIDTDALITLFEDDCGNRAVVYRL